MTARRPLAFLLLLVTLLAGCRGPDYREVQKKRAAAEQQRRQAQLLCQQTRQALPPLLAGFSRSRDRLASIESEAYVPSPAPAPLDPEEQRRLAVYDQEIEQEQSAAGNKTQPHPPHHDGVSATPPQASKRSRSAAISRGASEEVSRLG